MKLGIQYQPLGFIISTDIFDRIIIFTTNGFLSSRLEKALRKRALNEFKAPDHILRELPINKGYKDEGPHIAGEVLAGTFQLWKPYKSITAINVSGEEEIEYDVENKYGKPIFKIPICKPGEDVHRKWRKIQPISWNQKHPDDENISNKADEILLKVDSRERLSVFISYKREDALEIADQIYKKLIQKKVDVFIDRYGIEVGTEWEKKIKYEIMQSPAMIVIESEKAISSKYVKKEIEFANDQKKSLFSIQLPRAKRIAKMKRCKRLKLTKSDINLGIINEKKLEDFIKQILYSLSKKRIESRDNLVKSICALLKERDMKPRILGRGLIQFLEGRKKVIALVTPKCPTIEDFRRIDNLMAFDRKAEKVVIGKYKYSYGEIKNTIEWISKKVKAKIIETDNIENWVCKKYPIIRNKNEGH